MTSATRAPLPALTDFSVRRPLYRTEQRRALEWLAEAHAGAQATLEGWSASEREVFVARIRKLIERCACDPTKIGSRDHVVPDFAMSEWEQMSLYDVTRHPQGRGSQARNRVFEEQVNAYFEAEYDDGRLPPRDLVHVTCTGYASPSGAQRLVQKKGWGALTRVTHAYHMGCYAAFPATRLAVGFLHTPDAMPAGAERRVDVVHTELSSLHLDPSVHSIEQVVVQSLFADGLIRYSVREGKGEPGLQLIAQSEQILPDSADTMSWTLSDFGMQMTLGWSVPDRVGSSLRSFLAGLYAKAGTGVRDHHTRTVFALHPGGPKIIDRACELLELTEAQVRISREVLFDHGNMSSATLPHVWARIVADEKIAPGTPIVSLAFGPGLTVCGGVFRKQ